MKPILAMALAMAFAPAAYAEDLRVELGTGGDDLRGGNDNVHVRVLDNAGQVVGNVWNANELRRLADHTSHVVRVRLNPGVPANQIAAIELETTFTGGPGGDNWNLESLRVAPHGQPRESLFEATGRPLFRFTGEERVRRFTWVTHHCTADRDCDDGHPGNGTETCVGQPRALDGQSVRACRAGSPPPCPSGSEYSPHDRRCIAQPRDEDGDGAASIETGGNDCDDQDRTRYPGAPEVCDAHGKDEDCDFATVGSRDLDGDGHVDDACFNWGPPPRQ